MRGRQFPGHMGLPSLSDGGTMVAGSSIIPKRVVDRNDNLTGRSIKGAGGMGKSTQPCSQSGMDPNLVRGKSS